MGAYAVEAHTTLQHPLQGIGIYAKNGNIHGVFYSPEINSLLSTQGL